MTYVPHTDADRAAMLDAIGMESLEKLFGDVPERCRFPALDLPGPASELDVERAMCGLAGDNRDVTRHDCFLGAGAYHHYIPATVDYVLRRGEFYTSYTPYQPEVSQGMLQAAFEYQSMICRLTAMEVSNASHYDGATSLAEGVLLALDVTEGNRNKVVLSRGVHPQYREVVRTYMRGSDAVLVQDESWTADAGHWISRLDNETAALVIQNPNFLGQFEEVSGLAEAVHAAGALLIVVADPVSLGLFTAPGAYGADVVVADGQALGIPLSFGGPHLGIFATRMAYVRRLMGRVVGETVDVEGKRGYVLTLGTREQHIRRAKATSNICTNAALTALGTAVYLATLGKSGLRQLAMLCFHKSHYAATEIAKATRCAINPQAPAAPFFKEFVIRLNKPVATVNKILLEDFGLIGGYDLGTDDPRLENHMLVAVTEMNARSSIDRLVCGLRKTTA